MDPTPRRTLFALAVLAIAALPPAAIEAREISSWARINEDGSLRIDGKTVHLYGIHIPRSNRTCRSNRNPPVCGSRAAIALDFKVDGFVRCEIVEQREDRSVVGWCRVNAGPFDEGEDLSAYLLEKGWAVALPEASIEYRTLEDIARRRGIGMWGIPVDNVSRRP